MAYVKTEWQDGDTITANRLNNIEDGIKDLDDNSGVLIVNMILVQDQDQDDQDNQDTPEIAKLNQE